MIYTTAFMNFHKELYRTKGGKKLIRVSSLLLFIMYIHAYTCIYIYIYICIWWCVHTAQTCFNWDVLSAPHSGLGSQGSVEAASLL